MPAFPQQCRKSLKKKQYDEHKLRISALKNNEELYKKESAALEAEKIAAKKILAKRDTLYKKYEDAVDHYNALSVSRRGEDYLIGRYYKTNDREQLDVYEFQDIHDLKHLLIHEFGHALGLDHTNNINDVMYELNKTTHGKLTVGDIVALGRLCRGVRKDDYALVPMIDFPLIFKHDQTR